MSRFRGDSIGPTPKRDRKELEDDAEAAVERKAPKANVLKGIRHLDFCL